MIDTQQKQLFLKLFVVCRDEHACCPDLKKKQNLACMYEFVGVIGEHVARLGTITKSVGEQDE